MKNRLIAAFLMLTAIPGFASSFAKATADTQQPSKSELLFHLKNHQKRLNNRRISEEAHNNKVKALLADFNTRQKALYEEACVDLEKAFNSDEMAELDLALLCDMSTCKQQNRIKRLLVNRNRALKSYAEGNITQETLTQKLSSIDSELRDFNSKTKELVQLYVNKEEERQDSFNNFLFKQLTPAQNLQCFTTILAILFPIQAGIIGIGQLVTVLSPLRTASMVITYKASEKTISKLDAKIAELEAQV